MLYKEEYKQNVVKMFNSPENILPKYAFAKKMGINVNTLGKWINKFGQNNTGDFVEINLASNSLRSDGSIVNVDIQNKQAFVTIEQLKMLLGLDK